MRPVTIVLFLVFAAGCTSSETSVPNVHTVTPGVLVRGGQPDEAGLRALQKTYDIRTVVNFNDKTAGGEAATTRRLGLNYLAVPSNAFHLEQGKLLAFLKAVADPARNGPVYVHCKEGMDRTGVAVAAYRIVDCGWDGERALAELRSHQAFPHGLVFQNIPPYVRHIGRNAGEWADQLNRAPDPPIERPGAATPAR